MNGEIALEQVDAPHCSTWLAHTSAVRVLEEYAERDGIGIDHLMDSKKQGGLTYNDFLVLPGYIGLLPSSLILRLGLSQSRFSSH